jgi:hypothetical protein
MKPIHILPVLSLLLLFTPFSGNAAGSMLRIACDGDNKGAEVQINGKFKGECPIDIQTSEGTYKLRVGKSDASYDYIFEQDIRMGDGVIKKVEVVLSKRLNAAGQRLEEESIQQLGIAMQVGSEWSINMQDENFVYTGYLSVHEKLGTNAFKGIVEISYILPSTQRRQKIMQEASITIERSGVTIHCSNPVYIEGTGKYSPDNFYMTIANPRHLRGTNGLDGSGGEVTLTRK